MWPKISAVRVVGDAPNHSAGGALAAQAAEQQGYALRRSPDFAAALAAPVEGLEIVVLLEARPEEIASALAAVDSRGLPRWAVVPPSDTDARATAFGAEPCDGPMLAAAMRSAVALLGLRRDNARLCGDLCTVGRRLAHDLRTPLNSINTANGVLAEPAGPGDLGPQLRRSITDAVNEAGSLIERVGAVLLASSRPVDLQPTDMEEVVWNARQRLDARTRSAGATIIACDKWPIVNGVASLLELVWSNLLLNSLEHAGPAPRIEVGWNRGEGGTRFWVHDNGPGVAMAKRARLFHPLDRLNELNAPRGYGLAIVQRLIELQLGTVGYTQDATQGPTFFFILPATLPVRP
jgi:light-regulated signal transduction histidine kinase (bacteriophytochrome)